MSAPDDSSEFLRFRESVHERGSTRLVNLENAALVIALVATAIRHGLRQSTERESELLGAIVMLMAAGISVSCIVRYRWSLRRASFRRENWAKVGFSGLYLLGIVLVVSFATSLPPLDEGFGPRVSWSFAFSEVLILILGFLQGLAVSRAYAAKGINPALLLVGSFAVLITIGTFLLMLPRSRAQLPGAEIPQRAPFITALFTSTSASCVTGLVVEPTGTYWSRFGQSIILILFQVGGLGIMTFGALFIAIAGRGLQVRETATLRKLLDSERLSDVRQLLITILIFTFATEILGAVMISGLWSDVSPGERCFQSVFHSVSAFCNAGFSLTDNSFVGMSHRWEVWLTVPLLIITGGLGFGVVFNLFRTFRAHWKTPSMPLTVERDPLLETRISLTTRIVLWTTLILLLVGTFGYYMLESLSSGGSEADVVRWSDAWFQSVTYRTAGFNTVDLGQVQTTTKLFSVAMMFIGASPGSTGGGVKTVCIALLFLSVIALLRGKDRLEIGHRWVPPLQIQRAFLIITLSMLIVMVSTFLLVLFEDQPRKLIDHLFESTSAFATVGLSTGITPELTPPSRLVIVLTMFVGRVGPLTLLLALAGKQQRPAYDLPTERVALG
jgi:trk system potassium uptake protein TrkH